MALEMNTLLLVDYNSNNLRCLSVSLFSIPPPNHAIRFHFPLLRSQEGE